MPTFSLCKAVIEKTGLQQEIVLYHATVVSESNENAIKLFNERHPLSELETEVSVIEIEDK